MLSYTHLLGIDASLSATAYAILSIEKSNGQRWGIQLVKSDVIQTYPETPLRVRLRDTAVFIAEAANWAANFSLGAYPLPVARGVHKGPLIVGIEDFSRGSRFRREEAGMSTAVTLLGLQKGIGTLWRNPAAGPVMIPPREVKKTVLPNWHGWSKAHWVASGRTHKFKMSMPDKVSVQSALMRTYRFRFDDEHQADAACVALAVAKRKKLIP